mmetsp:Transcript_1781/g.5406  ORF Transcript_1781/g.5406 Transcript_1781/m.5406 type:complete len:247 (-) Transcript_1781:150-890(-)
MLVHGRRRTHAIKKLVFLSIHFYELTAGLIVSRKHAAEHDKVGSGAKSFGHVARCRAASVRDDVPAETVRGISALDDRAQLGITNPSLLSRRTYRAGTNAHFDNVSTRQDKFFDHLSRHNISCDDVVLRKLSANFSHIFNKMFAVAVCDVQTDERRSRGDFNTLLEAFKVRIAGTGANGGKFANPLFQLHPILGAVMLRRRGKHLLFGQYLRDLKSSGRVHVGGDYGYARPLPPILEHVRPFQLHL